MYVVPAVDAASVGRGGRVRTIVEHEPGSVEPLSRSSIVRSSDELEADENDSWPIQSSAVAIVDQLMR